jgi:uncharacterized membrane protein (GlpM family)
MRSRYAVWAYGLSLVGAVVGLGYQVTIADMPASMKAGMMGIMPYVIILVALGLFLYARAMEKKGVLG